MADFVSRNTGGGVKSGSFTTPTGEGATYRMICAQLFWVVSFCPLFSSIVRLKVKFGAFFCPRTYSRCALPADAYTIAADTGVVAGCLRAGHDHGGTGVIPAAGRIAAWLASKASV